jgi:hypothetical protein
MIVLAVLASACGDGSMQDPNDDFMIDPGPDCSELVGESEGATCFDFNSGLAPGWTPEAGSWTVLNGAYIGSAATLDGATCQASSMVTSMFDGMLAKNVRIRLDMTAFDRPDKFVVLRGLDPNNRAELNFRARFTEQSDGDLVLQELQDCAQLLHTQWFEVSLPHELEQMVRAEITVLDDEVTVMVDDRMVLSGRYPLPDRAGQIGLGVIEGGTVVFDNIVIEQLDPTP